MCVTAAAQVLNATICVVRMLLSETDRCLRLVSGGMNKVFRPFLVLTNNNRVYYAFFTDPFLVFYWHSVTAKCSIPSVLKGYIYRLISAFPSDFSVVSPYWALLVQNIYRITTFQCTMEKQKSISLMPDS